MYIFLAVPDTKRHIVFRAWGCLRRRHVIRRFLSPLGLFHVRQKCLQADISPKRLRERNHVGYAGLHLYRGSHGHRHGIDHSNHLWALVRSNFFLLIITTSTYYVWQ